MADTSKDELVQLIKRFGAYLTFKFSNLFSISFNNLVIHTNLFTRSSSSNVVIYSDLILVIQRFIRDEIMQFFLSSSFAYLNCSGRLNVYAVIGVVIERN